MTPNIDAEVPQELIDILVHATGAEKGNPGWRNHFAAAHDTDDYRRCERLVQSGHMTKGSEIGYGDLFHATKKGIETASAAVLAAAKGGA